MLWFWYVRMAPDCMLQWLGVVSRPAKDNRDCICTRQNSERLWKRFHAVVVWGMLMAFSSSSIFIRISFQYNSKLIKKPQATWWDLETTEESEELLQQAHYHHHHHHQAVAATTTTEAAATERPGGCCFHPRRLWPYEEFDGTLDSVIITYTTTLLY